jgi:TPP-dependent pyruvate/acetoin dehydrogenase alpha subunit
MHVMDSGSGRASPPIEATDAARARELYEAMVLIRVFEEETDRQYKRDRIGGYCHLCSGQEGATSEPARRSRPTISY